MSTYPAIPGVNLTWTPSTVSCVRFGQVANTDAASNYPTLCQKIIDIKLKDDDDNDDDSGGGDGDDIIIMLNIECDNLLMPPLKAETPKSFSGSRGAFMK